MAGDEDSWARLRQVVLAATDLEPAVTTLREGLGLGEGFTDPELADHGLADRTFPLGGSAYLEVVSPMLAEHPVARWLERVGGAGGYCLSVQVPDVVACVSRAVKLDVRVAVEAEAMGHRIVQLHPKDVGLLLELDGIADRDAWFWDDITSGPQVDALADGLLAVEIGVPEPERMAATWAGILDVARPTPASVDLGAEIRFVPAQQPRLLAVRLRGTGRVDTTLVGVRMTTG